MLWVSAGLGAAQAAPTVADGPTAAPPAVEAAEPAAADPEPAADPLPTGQPLPEALNPMGAPAAPQTPARIDGRPPPDRSRPWSCR